MVFDVPTSSLIVHCPFADETAIALQPREVDLRSLESYCQQIGVFVQVVPRGMDIRPPTQNVQEFGHNPQLKNQKSQLDYLFQMSDIELDETGALETSELHGAWD